MFDAGRTGTPTPWRRSTARRPSSTATDELLTPSCSPSGTRAMIARGGGVPGDRGEKYLLPGRGRGPHGDPGGIVSGLRELCYTCGTGTRRRLEEAYAEGPPDNLSGGPSASVVWGHSSSNAPGIELVIGAALGDQVVVVARLNDAPWSSTRISSELRTVDSGGR